MKARFIFFLIGLSRPVSVVCRPWCEARDVIGHGIDQRDSRIVMVQDPLNSAKVPRLAEQLDSVDLAERVRAEVLRQSEGPLCPLQIPPHSLSGLMAGLAPWRTWKSPYRAALGPYSVQKGRSEVHSPPFSCLSLLDRHSLFEVGGPHLQHVRDAQAGVLSDNADQAVLRHQEPINHIQIIVGDVVRNDSSTPFRIQQAPAGGVRLGLDCSFPLSRT